MTNDINDDDYVANLLKQDAKSAKKKYELVGIDAFNPKRCVSSNYFTALAQVIEVLLRFFIFSCRTHTSQTEVRSP